MSDLTITGSPDGSELAQWVYVSYTGYNGSNGARSAFRESGKELVFDQTKTYTDAATITTGLIDSIDIDYSTLVQRTLREFPDAFSLPSSLPASNGGQGCQDFSGEIFGEDVVSPTYHQINTDNWDHFHTERIKHSFLWDGAIRELPAQKTYEIFRHNNYEVTTTAPTGSHSIICVMQFPIGGNTHAMNISVGNPVVTYARSFEEKEETNYTYEIYVIPDVLYSGVEFQSVHQRAIDVDQNNWYFDTDFSKNSQHIIDPITTDKAESVLYIEEHEQIIGNVVLPSEPKNNSVAFESTYRQVVGSSYVPTTFRSTFFNPHETAIYTYPPDKLGIRKMFYRDAATTIDLGERRASFSSRGANINGSQTTDLSTFSVGDSLTLTINVSGNISAITELSGANSLTLQNVTRRSLDTFADLDNGATVWLTQELNGVTTAYRCTSSNLIFTDTNPIEYRVNQAEGSKSNRFLRRNVTSMTLTIAEIISNAGEGSPYAANTGFIGCFSCENVWDLHRMMSNFFFRQATNIFRSTALALLWEADYTREILTPGNPIASLQTTKFKLATDGSVTWDPRGIQPDNARYYRHPTNSATALKSSN